MVISYCRKATVSCYVIPILLKNLGIITHKVRRVMICGGGKVSYYLAERLKKSSMIVQIIEQDYEKCLDLGICRDYPAWRWYVAL